MKVDKTSALLAALLIAPALTLAGCGGDDGPSGTTNNEAPALPDQASLSMDSSAFPNTGSNVRRDQPNDVVYEDYGGGRYGKGAPASGTPTDSMSYSNYIVGRSVATAVNVAIGAFAAAPAAAFAGAFLATPVQEEDGSWTWSYGVIYGSVSYTLSLNGRWNGSATDWAMRVTTSGLTQNVTNFLWYSGQTQNAGSMGYWQLYDMTAPQTPTNLLRVDWNRASADNRSMVWLNNRVGGTAYGDNLTYAQNEDAVSMDYLDASSGVTSFVRWNIDTTAGSVRLPMYNGGQEACWDEDHLNASCSSQ